MPKVLVDSAERVTGTSPRDYTFQTWAELGNVRNLQLIGAYVPNTLPNIWPNAMGRVLMAFSINNLSVDGISPTIADLFALDFPTFLTGDQIAERMQTYIRANVATQSTITITFDEMKGCLVVTPDGTNKLLYIEQYYSGTTPVGDVKLNHDFWGMVYRTYPTNLNGTISTTGYTAVIDDSDYATKGVQYVGPLNLSLPRYVLCDMDIGAGSSNDLNTDGNSHSFVVPLTTDWGMYEKMTAFSDYSQRDRAPNLHLYKMHIRWLPPYESMNDEFDLWSFMGHDHCLLFEY